MSDWDVIKACAFDIQRYFRCLDVGGVQHDAHFASHVDSWQVAVESSTYGATGTMRTGHFAPDGTQTGLPLGVGLQLLCLSLGEGEKTIVIFMD